MPISIYNSLTGKKEELPKTGNKPLRLFVCGPTVYDAAHIGHARTYLFFDTTVRYLKTKGRAVFYLQNITNIDDKIIARAKERGIPALKLADEFAKMYREDMKALGATSVNAYAPATKFIAQIVKQVKELIKKGYAYEIPGDGWYFDIRKFSDYGKLSHRTAAGAEDALTRIDESVKKRNKGDFCLWKITDAKNAQPRLEGESRRANGSANDAKKKFAVINGEPAWNTELGWGRPGWHIEDTAISQKYFGPQYELHGGGLDLKFPHHEAEIAQAESASGKKPFVKIWMHVGMLTVEGQKMSKSLKNFITIRDFLSKYSPSVLRLIVASRHYRSPLDYSEENAESAKTSLESIREFSERLVFAGKNGRTKGASTKKEIKILNESFDSAMDDDLNTPEALSAIFTFINSLNPNIWNISRREALLALKTLNQKLKILGIETEPLKIPLRISRLAAKRELFRSNKQFAQSDALRKEIERLGYKIEDTPLGPLVLKKN